MTEPCGLALSRCDSYSDRVVGLRGGGRGQTCGCCLSLADGAARPWRRAPSYGISCNYALANADRRQGKGGQRQSNKNHKEQGVRAGLQAGGRRARRAAWRARGTRPTVLKPSPSKVVAPPFCFMDNKRKFDAVSSTDRKIAAPARVTPLCAKRFGLIELPEGCFVHCCLTPGGV